MSVVTEQWTWRGRCSCSASFEAKATDLLSVQDLRERWLVHHPCHEFTCTRSPADTSIAATLYEAACGCGRWREQWGSLRPLKASWQKHVEQATRQAEEASA